MKVNYKTRAYDVLPLTSKGAAIEAKMNTLEDILDDYFHHGCKSHELECSLVCWIDAWQKARDTKECIDKSLVSEATDFIEFLYELIIGSQRRIIERLQDELEKIASSD